eukprot:g1322.t1
MEVDPSVLASGLRDQEPKREANVEQKSKDMVFWLRNLEMEWKYINSKIESALERRKQSSLEELRCAVMAITAKQRQVTEMKTQICNLRLQSTTGKLFSQLGVPIQSFSEIQESLLQKVRILKDSMVHSLENVPLVDGTVLGDNSEKPDVENFSSLLKWAASELKEFSQVLLDFKPSRSPSPMGSRSPSPHSNPMRNLEIIDGASQELKSVVEEEVTLMKEIGELLSQKRSKELRLNTMRIYQDDCKHLNLHDTQFT